MVMHRNTGAPFMRVDGSVWESGADKEPTKRELSQFKYKLKPIHAAIPQHADIEEIERKPDAPPGEWPVPMSPKQYLRLHPEGPHADLARMLLAPDTLPPEEKSDGIQDNEGRSQGDDRDVAD